MPHDLPITPAQCRMARAALDISRDDLGRMSNLSGRTVQRFEAGEKVGSGVARLLKLELASRGVRFLTDDGVARAT